MAAFLNKPSDFSQPKQQNVDQLQLMPPCAFETRKPQSRPKSEISPDIANEDVTKAKEEIKKLKEEIEHMRLEHQRSVIVPYAQPQEPKLHIVHPPASKDETRFADELIRRQNQEIEDLKAELRERNHEHKEHVKEMERQLSLQEQESAHRASSLEHVIRENEERYEQQVDRLSHQHQKELDDVNSALDNTTRELSATKSEYVARLRGLETEIESLRSDSAATITQLEAELRSKSCQLENQSQQISQLKTYIGESEKSYQPPQVWRKEKETLNNKLKICAAEKENLESNMELLNIRLKSVSEILTVQESELSKGKSESISNNKQEGLLLSRWRDKVFALLVQQKSADIVRKKDEQNWKEKVHDLESKLRSSENRAEVLTHTLSEKTAQLQMEQNNAMRYQEEITQAQQVALCLDDQLAQNRTSSACLSTFAESVSSQYEENAKILHSALDTLRAYGQRISFASSRVEMLQGQFARKEAILRLEAKDAPEAGHDGDKSAQDSNDHLSEELERVMAERDMLAAQIQQDAAMLADKVNMARSQYEGEITKLKQTVEDLEVAIQEKSQTCGSLSERLEQAETQLEEQEQSLSILRTEMSKQEQLSQSVLEEQRKADRDSHSEQLAEMDRKLNEARREHTKAVVSVRQLERQMEREKERTRGEMGTLEEHYKGQVERLHAQLVATEKERNLMMATLRQEGLMSKIRSERGEPAQLPPDTDTDIPPAKPKQPAEPMTSVLNDLRSLTAAVLEEDEDTSEGDENS